MGRLNHFKENSKPLSNFFIAARYYPNNSRIEFGVGWNESNRVSYRRHILTSNVKEVLDPICSNCLNSSASIHNNVFTCIEFIPLFRNYGEKLIVIGADNIEMTENVSLLFYGNDNIKETLISMGYTEPNIDSSQDVW